MEFFSSYSVVSYFKKQSLLPHSWSGRDLHEELTPLQKACLSLQLNKVTKLLGKNARSLRSSDVTSCGAELTPLECALKENACVLLSRFTTNHKTYRYQINSYTSRRKTKTRRSILTALLRAGIHKETGWSVLRPSDIPWSMIDRDECRVIIDIVDLSASKVLQSIAHSWITWLKNIYYNANDTFFLNHLNPFHTRYPRYCIRYQSRLMVASIKHGIEPATFHTVNQLMATRLDNAVVFQAMLVCYRLINGRNVRVSDFDWISHNLSSILETEIFVHRSIYRALLEYISLALSESVSEFDNSIRENIPQHLPGYVLTRFKVLARGLACMDRDENRYLSKLLPSTLKMIEHSLSVFSVEYEGDSLDKLACCFISALTTFRHEMKLNQAVFCRLRSCTAKVVESADASLSDYLLFVIMRQAITNIPIGIQDVYIPNIFYFLSEMGVDLNIRSKVNKENLLLTCISNFKFACLLLELLLSVKVYPFTVNSLGACFANRVNEFFAGGYDRLDEDDFDSLEFLLDSFPLLKKPYPLKILAARASAKSLLKFPALIKLILPQRKLIDFIKLHATDPDLIRNC